MCSLRDCPLGLEGNSMSCLFPVQMAGWKWHVD